jgi:type IV secretory pathway VirJ component
MTAKLPVVILLALTAGAAAAGAAAKTHKAPAAPGDGADAHLAAGRFGTVSVYIPDGKPNSVAIFLSGDGGWELGVINMAKALRNTGAVVIGADIRHYLASLGSAAAKPSPPCQMIAVDFEALSHQVQKEIGMREYHVPVLVGYSSGATVVYATLVQSPPGTFAGALSLGFCADQDFAGAALCPGAGLHYTPNAQHELVLVPSATLKQPWIAFQGQKDDVCSPQAADEFAAQVANAEMVRLPLVGHGFSVERNCAGDRRSAGQRSTRGGVLRGARLAHQRRWRLGWPRPGARRAPRRERRADRRTQLAQVLLDAAHPR